MQCLRARLCIVALLVGAASLGPGAAAAESLPRDLELRLVLLDPCQTATSIHDGALREIARLLAPAGVRVAHRVAVEPQALGGVYVILLPRDRRGPAEGSVAGLSPAQSGVQRAVWAFPPVIARNMGLNLARVRCWPDWDRRQYERALALVVVHELAHVLAGAAHRREGLMAPRLRPAQLLDPRLVLDDDLRPAFLAGVARLDDGDDPGGAALRVARSPGH